jgi:DNA polymerase I
MNALIYGKNPMERIVSIEPNHGKAEVFRELADGSVVSETVPCTHYILYHQQHSPKMKPLVGNQFYKYIMEYTDATKFSDVLASSYKQKYPLHVIRDPKESMMVKDGYTYFKGMKVEDVSVLSFDIETTGLTHDKNSRVLLISNTFRRNGQIVRKLFSLDEYTGMHQMIRAWCAWVRQMDPSVIVGHNLYGFDLPYLHFCSGMLGFEGLNLGRDGSVVRFANRTSQFRKDSSQAYDYSNAYIYGREIVDTWFLSMKYDVSARREYESYGLKAVVEHELEGLRSKKKNEPKKFTTDDQMFLDRLSHGGNRTLVDASKIKEYYANRANNPGAWQKVKSYAIDDADDALTLYDLMVPSFFYYAQACPRSLQTIVNTASGSQFNSLMVRSYLQQGHSIALGSEKEEYAGAISFGVPGIHKNVFKIDVQSLYPSIIISKRLCNRDKDPQENFLKIMEFFTAERIQNKEMYEKTGERYYLNLSDSQKVNVINSGYGFLGAPKLNYNSPADADAVTAEGREILKKTILFITGKEYVPELEEDGDTDEVA